MPKPKPKTGEKRAVHQPLKIDKLPPKVHQDILRLKNDGESWEAIEALSSSFVDWDKLPAQVSALFPGKYLPHTNLHRWHDLRYIQVRKDVMARAEQAREIAEAFAKFRMKDGDESVINAARSIIMGILAEDTSSKARERAARSLIQLSEVMQQARGNVIKERRVAAEERRITQLEKTAEMVRGRMEAETQKAAKKLSNGQLTIDDINKLRERTFGLPPLAADAQVANARK